MRGLNHPVTVGALAAAVGLGAIWFVTLGRSDARRPTVARTGARVEHRDDVADPGPAPARRAERAARVPDPSPEDPPPTPAGPATPTTPENAKPPATPTPRTGREPRAARPGAGAKPADAQVAAEPVVPEPIARQALSFVGADPLAEAAWAEAINDPAIGAEQRKDLIEDLNQDGFPDPKHLTSDDLPLIVSRLALIEELAPDAMDEVNAAAFAEAYKDLVNMLVKASQQ